MGQDRQTCCSVGYLIFRPVVVVIDVLDGQFVAKTTPIKIVTGFEGCAGAAPSAHVLRNTEQKREDIYKKFCVHCLYSY